MENNEELLKEEITSEDETALFQFVDENPDAAEKITAPRYSYWKSVLRVFFRKKSNWIALALFVLILILTYIYGSFLPTNFMDYKQNANVTIPVTHNLTPGQAYEQFGFDLKYLILGTGNYGESLWEHIWKGA